MPRRNAPRDNGQYSKRRGMFSRGVAVSDGNNPANRWRPAVEEMVQPSGRCGGTPAGKLRFLGEEVAAAALEQTRRKRHWQGSDHVEKRYYACKKCSIDGEPTAYHLTSVDYNGSDDE